MTVASPPLALSIIGFGTVGRGLAKALLGKGKRLQEQFRVVSVTDTSGTLFSPGGVDLASALAAKERHGRLSPTRNPKSKIQNPKSEIRRWGALEAIERAGADVAVELTPTDMQTGEPCAAHIRKALSCGKHVVTANKGPLALDYGGITAGAKRRGLVLDYGGSVCGALPIIEVARDALRGNSLIEIRGVFNGTTNHILSRMEEGASYGDALADAQRLGIAESDPSQDIGGWDAAAKVVILANAVMGRPLSLADVAVEGIEGVTPGRVRRALRAGRRLRLVGEVNRRTARVGLEEVPAGHPLAVTGTLNVAVIQTDLAKDITLIGRGAGQMETASAILNDLFHIRSTVTGAEAAPRVDRSGATAGSVATSRLVAVRPTAPLVEAVNLMRASSISQVPVLSGDGRSIGTVSESTVLELLSLGAGPDELGSVRVVEVMHAPLPEVGDSTPLSVVESVLAGNAAVLVSRGGRTEGIVTRSDLLRLVSGNGRRGPERPAYRARFASVSVIDDIIVGAAQAFPREASGVLLGRRDNGTFTIREAVADSAEGNTPYRFQVRPDLLYGLYRSERPGRRIVGFFHSHPKSGAFLSPNDHEGIRATPGLLWLVYGTDGFGGYIYDDGEDSVITVELPDIRGLKEARRA